jgi:hypothetical protein
MTVGHRGWTSGQGGRVRVGGACDGVDSIGEPRRMAVSGERSQRKMATSVGLAPGAVAGGLSSKGVLRVEEGMADRNLGLDGKAEGSVVAGDNE